MVMEIVGCAASVSQLLVYIALSSGRLEKLCAELKDGSSTYREEESNISILLGIIKRLSRRNIANEDSILPVLIAISTLACQALHLLRPNKVLGINWTPITAHEKIKSAFQSLDKKRTLLHLYISQTHHDALIDLRETIETSNMSSSKTPMAETSGTSMKDASDDSDSERQRNIPRPNGGRQERTRRSRVVITNSTNSGFNSIFNGTRIPDADFRIDGFTQTAQGVSALGNEKPPSDRTLLEAFSSRSSAQTASNAVPPTTYTNTTDPRPATTDSGQIVRIRSSIDDESPRSSSDVSNSRTASQYDQGQPMGLPDSQVQSRYYDNNDRHVNDSGYMSAGQQQMPWPAQEQPTTRTEERSPRPKAESGERVQKKGRELRTVRSKRK